MPHSPVIVIHHTLAMAPEWAIAYKLRLSHHICISQRDVSSCVDQLFLLSSSDLPLEEPAPGSCCPVSLGSRRKPRKQIKTKPMAWSQAQLTSSLEQSHPAEASLDLLNPIVDLWTQEFENKCFLQALLECFVVQYYCGKSQLRHISINNKASTF